MATTYKNILIIKPSALGDIVHALPVLGALRSVLPEVKITWLVRSDFAPLLECVDGIDEILLFDRKLLGRWWYRPSACKALRTFLKTLKSNQYDLVLDLQGLFRTAFFAWKTGCPTRIGMTDSREFAGLFYTRKVLRPEHSLHVLDFYFALLRHAGIKTPPPTSVQFKVPETTIAAVQEKLKKANANPNYFVLIPGSAHASKCWPADRFTKLADDLHRTYNADIILVGTQKDKSMADAIQAQCSLRLIDMTSQTSIPELIALLQKAKGVVSNDTGPGYIAAEACSATVIIYGNVNPQRLAPYGRPECVAAIDPDGRGTGIRTSDPAHDVTNVTFETVWEKLNALLADNPINQT